MFSKACTAIAFTGRWVLRGGIDPSVQRGIRDDLIAPDPADRVSLADRTRALRDEIEQAIEHLLPQAARRPCRR
ncbi:MULTISPECIES: hypothetical protein [Bradyrhizobium]|uniref:hypothetical protein n=1 Tax=Bradyrhizobium TaxID=374 RepID=UPI00293F447D|nr:hypothetical protein [Bradyrhizobium sp. NDS-1]WOH74319.1 hypothetical protein RX330_04115 [Bradyrhizobium sp. NDS-1]